MTSAERSGRVAGCPVCGRPPAEGYRPFCSGRCADVDLGNWLSDRYAIPAADDEDESGEAAPGSAGQGPDGHL